MNWFPDKRNLDEHWLFSRAYYGELIGLLFSLFAVCRIITIPDGWRYAGFMLAVTVVQAFLIWAWGRRYPWMDWIYAVWSAPALLVSLALIVAAGMSATQQVRASSGGIQIGDGSLSMWGFAALLIAAASRSAGLFWWLFWDKSIEHRESSRIPAAALAGTLLLGIAYALASNHFVETLFMLGIGFYGMAVSI